MKRWVWILPALLLMVLPVRTEAVDLALTSRAAVLMEKSTGEILFTQNEHDVLEPASVTKVMTLLLTMEAIDSGKIGYDDVVTVSDYAASMGGSQVFLSPGEEITVEELLKSVCVSSGNDAAVALAEHVSGVTELFVEEMNNRARALGMNDTHFVNPTGLTAEGHVTSAWDIALMSRELLLHHPDIRRFTTIWMDTIRGGTFGLSNTNKLVRFYDGCTGLKTGYTERAGYCISATAEKDGMELIAVIMKGETADKRNEDAKTLLNYGFSTYQLTDITPADPLPTLPVALGQTDTVALTLPSEGTTVLRRKGEAAPETALDIPDAVTAPVTEGQQVGELTVTFPGGDTVRLPVLAAEGVARRTWGQLFADVARRGLFMK
ncbi:MAG: D-alanyl-D-alanine carboxypeptidase [Oscillospiraceae bacterium]|nr:D-alanyl-D-alanine carboxypeptidase [Oscillospiraceae bacterium]